jgi:hypothetical protein
VEDHESSKGQLTGAGCVILLLSVILIFAVALPIVRWRDPDTGKPLPRFIAIFAPVLVGACFNAAAGFVLRLIGIESWKQAVSDDSSTPGNSQTPAQEPHDSGSEAEDQTRTE